jgi:branched-subunit amino acid ABC-type transport system permease component
MPGPGALFLLAFAALVAAVLLVLLQLTRLGYLVRATIPDRPRRRMFIASVSLAACWR